MFPLQVSPNLQLFEYGVFEGVKLKYAWENHPFSHVSLSTWALKSTKEGTRYQKHMAN